MRKPEAFVDLHRLSEDERIDMIGHTVTEHGKTVGVCCHCLECDTWMTLDEAETHSHPSTTPGRADGSV